MSDETKAEVKPVEPVKADADDQVAEYGWADSHGLKKASVKKEDAKAKKADDK